MIQGKTTTDSGEQRIEDMSFKDLGASQPDRPVELKESHLEGAVASQRVRMQGTLLSMEVVDDHLEVVVNFMRKFHVRIYYRYYSREQLDRLIGAHVEVIGLLASDPAKPSDRFSDTQLFSTGDDDLRVLQRGPADRFAGEITSITEVKEESAVSTSTALVKVEGVVVDLNSGGTLVIESSGQRLKVETVGAQR